MRILTIVTFILFNSQTLETLYAKDNFSPIIQVDDMVITKYEINQRALFFKLLNFPGNPQKEAEKTLIESRLKFKAAQKLGIKVTPEELSFEMKIFAQRANLSIDQFATRLKKNGVDKVTWENYMMTPILWFKTVNKKFSSEISANNYSFETKSEWTVKSEAQVLLTEIIVPIQQVDNEKTNTTVKKLKEIRSLKKFSEAAYKYSAAPTREFGGKITWQDISSLPTALRPLVAGLSIGEVTEPLPIPGGLALYQLRDIREKNLKQPKTEFIDFIEIQIEKKVKKIKSTVIQNVLVCDDLYTITKNFKLTNLVRKNTNVSSLPVSTKKTLSKLDQDEFIFINREDNKSVLLMVCQRTEKENLSKEKAIEINERISKKRLYNLGNSYIENLRQAARIEYK